MPKAMDKGSGDTDVRWVDCENGQEWMKGGALQRNGLRLWWLSDTEPEGENYSKESGGGLLTAEQVVIFAKGRSINNNWLD